MHAIVGVPECDYPMLPVRRDQSLFFPSGRLTGVWLGDELRYAQTQGARIIKVLAGLYFRERIDLSEWALAHYRARIESPFEGLYTKLLLNNLYGKWQQNKPQSVYGYGAPPAKALDVGSNYWALELQPKAPRWQNFPAAATILGRAHIALHKWLLRAHPVFACDTDGFFTRRALPTGDGLGELGVELEGRALFVAPKVYAVETPDGRQIYKCKGVTRGARAEVAETAAMKRVFRDLFALKTVTLTGLPTQLQLFERGKLDFLSEHSYRLHLDRVKRSYFSDGSSRAWTMAEIDAGEYDRPWEDRGVLTRLHSLLHGSHKV
jgi:hypothetical protein